MKVKSKVKAGGASLNHNQKVKGTSSNHNQGTKGLRVKSKVKAGEDRIISNHNQTVAR